jgi:thaumarchaeosortase
MVNLPRHFKASKEKIKGIWKTLVKILPIIALIPPFLILYFLYPATFETTWKGRTFYVFFVWLASLEVIMSWENLVPKVKKPASARNIVFITALLLPTICMIVYSYAGLNTAIINWAQLSNVGWPKDMPLSTEYLVFATLFALLMWSEFGYAGLKDSAISSLFLATIGIIYTIDTLYPYGGFTPFQALVPATSTLAANFLNLMGYTTVISEGMDSNGGRITYLQVQNPKIPISFGRNPVTFGIAWPCAGIESLIIYTITILVFLKSSALSWKRRTIYFSLGAIVTYFINVLRIATFFVLGMQYGQDSAQVGDFHNFYGSLYSITWIISYPLVIIGSQMLWNRVNGWRNEKDLRLKMIPSSVAA